MANGTQEKINFNRPLKLQRTQSNLYSTSV